MRRSWWCRGIGGTITTIIITITTIITASIVATTEVAEATDDLEQDLRVLFAFSTAASGQTGNPPAVAPARAAGANSLG
jgi:hypothetical protein